MNNIENIVIITILCLLAIVSIIVSYKHRHGEEMPDGDY